MTAAAPGGCGCGGSCAGGAASDTGCGCRGTCGGGASSTGCSGGTRSGWSSPVQAPAGMGYLLRNGMLKAGWEDDGPIQAPAGMGYLLRNGMLKRGWEKEGPVQAPAGMGYLLRNAMAAPQQRTSDHAERHYKKACRDATGATVPCEEDESTSASSSTSNGSSTGKPDTGSYGAKACLDPVTGAPEPCWENPYYSEHSSTTSSGSEGCDDLFTLEGWVRQYNCPGSGINRGDNGGYHAEKCWGIELPSTASSKPCFTGTPPNGWPPASGCGAPPVDQQMTFTPCNLSSFEFSLLKLRFLGCGIIDSSLDDLLAEGLCLLMQNLDLVAWATCLVDNSSGPCMVGVVTGAQSYKIDCLPWLAEVFTLGDTTYWGTEYPEGARALSLYKNGTESGRLCGIIRAAALIYHEMSHRCSMGGIYNLDVQNSPSEDPCEPTWLAYSTLLYALYIRYPLDRRSGCCDHCLEDLAWSSDVGDFLMSQPCTD